MTYNDARKINSTAYKIYEVRFKITDNNFALFP